MLFSEPKIPQSPTNRSENTRTAVSVLFSEPKIPQRAGSARTGRREAVSVLFSEPKIPQSTAKPATSRLSIEFQCSSASRKFLNPTGRGANCSHYCFSALQRAENSSTGGVQVWRCRTIRFQCSSASRKFLNPTLAPASIHIPDCDDHASSFLSLPGASP